MLTKLRTQFRLVSIALALLSPLGVLAGPGQADELPPEATLEVSFDRDVKPILERNCLGCHQDARQLGDYLMTDFDSMLAGGETGQPAIVAGDAEASYLFQQIKPVDGFAEMPKKAKPLADVEVAKIRQWINAGAVNDSPPRESTNYSVDNPPVYSQAPSVSSIDVSGNLGMLAVAGFHEVLLVDLADLDKPHPIVPLAGRLVGLSERIESIAFSPDGKRLAVAGGEPGRRGELQVWNMEQKELEISAFFTFDTLRGVSWSPDGSMIAFGGTDNALRAVDALTGELKLFQGAHEDWVLGTAFTAKGDHIVSVARDMTCKLTETATERFIDNITSITPGALKGGLSSVIQIPGREEILVGGADGIAKVYQVFRQTARKIGDDANLVRELPTLRGRISAVDVNEDATRLMALATIDNHAELQVWKTRPEAEFPEEMRLIQNKQFSERSEEERQKLIAFVAPAEQLLATVSIDDSAAYACCFLPGDKIAIAKADGEVLILGPDGQPLRGFFPAPIENDSTRSEEQTYNPIAWNEKQKIAVDPIVSELAIDPATITQIEVSPNEQISLNSPFEYVQLLVTGITEENERVDLTRIARYPSSELAGISKTGLLRPLMSGSGSISISFGDLVQTVPLTVNFTAATETDAEKNSFVGDVNPVMSRLGCNQGTCHGAQKGKAGFILSLRGYDPIFDVRALTDDLKARRINLASPDDSLMLLKALGRVPHEGGVLFEDGSPYHGIIRGWIADGAKLDLTVPRVASIEIQPTNPVANLAGSRQQVRVIAHYDNGSTRDVTREAYVDSGNTEVATATKTGLLTAVRRGEAALLARYEGKYAATTLTVMGQRDEFTWQAPEANGTIDRLVADKWQRMKILPSPLCDDETFLRRIYLDLTGLPPTAAEVREFGSDPRETDSKRNEVIDRLIGSPAFVEYWTNKWADLLQVNRKFLGPEGSSQFRKWIETAVAENRPYDQFAKQILTSTGSNKENPAASYYKILRTPEDTMENTTHLFLGVRFNCNKCHDHPFERWTQDQYYETAAFFAKTQLRPDPASGDQKIGGSAVEGAKPLYEEVYDAAEGAITHPRTGQTVAPKFPYQCDFEADAEASDRARLANWMTSADNPYFARSYVNRVWGYLLGVGLIEPIDDIRAGNPATNPELLEYLTSEFIDNGFDARHLMRMICRSRTYQLSVGTNTWNEDDYQNYSHATPRRLPAEVLYDSIHFVTGATSKIPGVPEGTRAAALPDAGVSTPDGFLANLGRPVRESACECERSSELQLGPIMALVSGPTVGSAISDEKNDLTSLVERFPDDGGLVEELFLRILSRYPTAAEMDAYATSMGLINEDHQRLKQELQDRETWWTETLPTLQVQQQSEVAETKAELTLFEIELKPERERLEAERLAKIAEAEQNLATSIASTDAILAQWQTQLPSDADWYPLRPVTVTASQGTMFKILEDRSIRADGSKEKGTYEIRFDATLKQITGFRLEALPVEGLAGGGPGFPGNGNFVLTEFEVLVVPEDGSTPPVPLKIAAGKASFTQAGFAIEQAFDGNSSDQLGWAVHPAGGVTQWANFKLSEPIASLEGQVLIIKLHQYHDAAEHRLARFRISTTTDSRELALGIPEAFASVLSIPAEQRSEADLKSVVDYLAKSDPTINQARQALATAQMAVPEDPQVLILKKRIDDLGQPIAVDSQLISLRNDLVQSELQMQNIRLTAAEDLTWALLNSPAFLFNR